MSADGGPGQYEASGQPAQGWDELGIVRRRGLRGWFRRHPRWMNAVVVAIYLASAAWWFPPALYDMGDGALWLLPGYAAMAVLLCFRHTWPLTVLAAVAFLETLMLLHYPWHGIQIYGVAFATYCVGRHRGLAWGLAAGVVACLPAYGTFFWAERWTEAYGESILFEAIYGPDFPPGTQEMLFWLGVIGTAMAALAGGIGAAVGRGRRHEQEILEWARRSHELAQVGERNRIAREMHDVVAHSLSVMISLADGARVVLRRDPERAGEVLEELSGTGRTALADMRRVIGVLRKGDDVVEARRPMRETLEELYEGFRQAGLPLTVVTTGPPLPEDTAFGLTVHRIIQEALTNVLRYGRRITEVEVRVEHTTGISQEEAQRLGEQGLSAQDQEALGMSTAGQVVITVTDDGLPSSEGRTSSMGSGQGIRGMGERAAFYNGSVYAGPGRHRGWMVRAVLEPPVGARRPDQDESG